jgi:phosphohistidine phosphatase
MKKIILVRHATAVAKGTDVADFKRKLRKRGLKEARDMVEWFADTHRDPDFLLSSPAVRAYETARVFARGLGYKVKKIATDEGLYGTPNSAEFLEILKQLDDKNDSVMVFGHDPAFTDFARYMIKGFNDALPKCAVLGFTVNRRVWRTMKSGDGRLEYFESPESLVLRRRRAKELRKNMSSKIENGIWKALSEFGIDAEADAAKKAQKHVRRASARIARRLAGVATAGKGKSA